MTFLKFLWKAAFQGNCRKLGLRYLKIAFAFPPRILAGCVTIESSNTRCSQDALVRREAVGGIELKIFHQNLR